MALLETIGTQAAGGILGMMFGKHNDKRQYEQQAKLSQLQMANDRAMTDYQHNKQLEMWKATSYVGQKEQMEKAGLNPALMYGMGGGGGVTTGAGAAHAGIGASAPQGGREIQDMMQMGLQLQMLRAQKENIEADTEVKKVDAAKRAGVDTENVKADTENKLMEKIIKEYTGKDLKDVYEKINVPNRGIQEKTYQDELVARQGVAQTIGELWEEGKLKDKGDREIEQLLLNNSKTREETKNIIKTFDILEEELKGAKLSNILLDVETQWAQGTGLKGGNIADIAMKIIGALLGMKIGNKPKAGGITINNIPRK